MSDLADILRRIVARRRFRIEQILDAGEAVAGVACAPDSLDRKNGFVDCLEVVTGRAVIAEVKLGSPRLGSLEGSVDPEGLASLYAQGGAAALSVVVEPDFFYGSYELLARCRRASGLPTLAKDFVIHPLQLEWARRAGADAVLLISAIVSRQTLATLAERARELGMVPLVECHSGADFDHLAGDDWELIGVNNRDLRTFEVDLDHSISLLQRIPEGARKVAESGIKSSSDIETLEAAGFDAFLVGESLLLAQDPGAKLAELVGPGSRR